MSRRARLLPLALMALLLAGCQSPGGLPADQRQQLTHRLSLAEQSFRVGLDLTHEGVTLGLIKPAELKPWVPVERAVGLALDAAEAVAADQSKTPTELEAAVAAVEAALPKLAPLLNFINRQKAAAVPAPAATPHAGP